MVRPSFFGQVLPDVYFCCFRCLVSPKISDSLYSILQMPRGFPVATMAIGAAGAANAGLMAAGILALQDAGLAARLDQWRADLSASIPDAPSDDG